MDPEFARALTELSKAYLLKGDSQRARTRADEAFATATRDVIALGDIGYVYARTGKGRDARRIAADLVRRARSREDGAALAAAMVFAAFGELDETFVWLNAARTPVDPQLAGFNVDPRFQRYARIRGSGTPCNRRARAVASDAFGLARDLPQRRTMSAKLSQFLIELASDARRLDNFLADPRAALDNAELTPDERKAVLAGDLHGSDRRSEPAPEGRADPEDSQRQRQEEVGEEAADQEESVENTAQRTPIKGRPRQDRTKPWVARAFADLGGEPERQTGDRSGARSSLSARASSSWPRRRSRPCRASAAPSSCSTSSTSRPTKSGSGG